MNEYVDGFVIPVPKDKIEEYRRISSLAGTVWRDHGALDYRECVGDDLQQENMVHFPVLANCKPDETVVFSWIVFESREHRDEVNAKVMKDPRLADMMNPDDMPFNCKRMAYGGFKTIVKA